MLVVVEDGNVELLVETLLDLEAARRGDVFEVHSAKRRCQRLDRLDDFLRVEGIQDDWHCGDTGELLEELGLSFHNWQCSFGADVAEAKDCGAVGDHRDVLAGPGVGAGQGRIFVDGLTDAGDTWGVADGEVANRLELHGRVRAELTAAVCLEDFRICDGRRIRGGGVLRYCVKRRLSGVRVRSVVGGARGRIRSRHDDSPKRVEY